MRKINPSNHIIKIFALGIILLFSIEVMTSGNIGQAADDVEWEIRLDFNESSGAYDFVVFGELSDANDESPPDNYDMPKPPPPMTPYIRAWFNSELEEPYNLLLKDYRLYPDSYKSWNLTVIWEPSGNDSSSSVTLSWSKENITNIEYDSIKFYKLGVSDPVSDLLVDSSYSFVCQAGIPQQFQIVCESESSDGVINIDDPLILVIILAIIIVIIVVVIVYWKKIRY